MPTAFIQSVARKQGKPVAELESKWDQAKARAAEEGHKEDWPYVTAIFKNMAHVPDKK